MNVLHRLSVLSLVCLLSGPALAACIDEERPDPNPNGAAGASVPVDAPARDQLLNLMSSARQRSNAVGAARLLAEASASDVEETKASGKPQASLVTQVGYSGSRSDGTGDSFGSSTSGAQIRASVNVAAPLFDFGRLDKLALWRASLAEAARLGQISTEEQVALQVVSLSVERSRYRLQAQVYKQYANKMSCLVDALGQIVKADKGRASELVQARKTQSQAELALDQSMTVLRQIEVRLRRFVGDPLPAGGGMASVLGNLPKLDEVQGEIERSTDVAALTAQADAAANYADAIVAGQKPQISWNGSGTKAVGAGNPASWSVGLAISVPLLNPGADAQASSARKRAEAARLQRAEGLDARKSRAAEIYEQGSSAMERARRMVEVLRDSDSVRNFTLQQWQQLGKRSLFDVMSAEGEHYNLRVNYVNALHDAQQSNAMLRSLGRGLDVSLR
ncbi:MAG TPA: TolC family protein [Ideonella sp.]|nr:TolC family protein [Ideonella sp.]